jgi:hypothetical protein
VPDRDLDPLLGDLDEEYGDRAAAASPWRASRWYWSQVLRSIPLLAASNVRRGGLLMTAGAALGAFVVSSVVEFGADRAVSLLFNPVSQLYTAVSLVGDLGALALGGYLAARVRPAASAVLAAMVFALVVLFMVIRPESVPLWYQIAFLVAGPLAALRGGTLHARRSRC